MRLSFIRIGLLAGLGVGAALASNYAQPVQVNPAGPPVVNPYYPQSYRGVGGAYAGQAQVLSAEGQLMTSQEQARIMREQANQAKIDTKHKAFNEALYEKAMTPTFTEEMNKNQSMILRRMMTNPLDVEVTSGKSQNVILPVLRNVATKGGYGPPIYLDQQMLKYINVTSTGKQGTGLGVLKDGGKNITWPIALAGSPNQQSVAEILPVAVSQASKGMLQLKTYTKLNSEMGSLKKELSQKFRKEEIDAALYLEGNRFMEGLEGSIAVLRLPSAPQYFNGNFTAQGRTVQELVENMTQKGLMFAPCDPGNEAPYFALQNALVAYASGNGQDASGFVSLQAAKYPSKTAMKGKGGPGVSVVD